MANLSNIRKVRKMKGVKNYITFFKVRELKIFSPAKSQRGRAHNIVLKN